MMLTGVSVGPAILFTVIMIIPVLRIKQDLLKFLKRVINFSTIHSEDEDCREQGQACLLDLPIIQFGDIQARRHRSIDETCFVCSEDYRNEDVVTQLSRCKHVFHTNCLQKELQRNQFSCPFCRNPAFKASVTSPCKQS